MEPGLDGTEVANTEIHRCSGDDVDFTSIHSRLIPTL